MDARNEIKQIIQDIRLLTEKSKNMKAWEKECIRNISYYVLNDFKMLISQLHYNDLEDEFK